MSELRPTRTAASLAFTALAAFALAACGGNTFLASAASGDSGAVTADQACTDNAHARCSRLATCSPADMDTTYGDEGTCETRLKLNCLNSLAAADNGNTPAQSEACAVAYEALSCDGVLDEQPPSTCLQAKGSRANGVGCGFPGQCASGYCAIVPGSACGTCANLPQAGDSCAQLTTCGQQLACESATTQLCTTFAASGTACSKTQPCGAGLSCVGLQATSTATCEASVETLNASCDPANKAGPACDRNAMLTCSGATKTCQTISVAAPGEPCGTVNQALVICGGAGSCVDAPADAGAAPTLDSGATTAAEVCLAPASDGAPCDTVQGPFCRAPARCILANGSKTSGTCQFQSPSSCP